MIDGSNNTTAIIEIATTNPPPGIHWIRINCAKGITNAISIAVDNLPQAPFGEQIESTPIALHGTLAGGAILKTTFPGKQNQPLVIDLEGRRLGSNIRPVVRLLNSDGVQIAWSPPQPTLMGDARISTTLPDDGTYSIELHDILFKGSGAGQFRLKIGNLQFADMVFPMAARISEDTRLSFSSSNLDSTLTVPASHIGTHPIDLPATGLATGTRPYILLSDHPEHIEDSASTVIPAAPVGINGRISKPGETDRYTVTATPGTKLRFNLLARRAGSPLDAVLTIKSSKGAQIGRNDDFQGTSDPGLDITVPNGSESITVEVTDLQNRGGDDFIYHIDIDDISAPLFSIASTLDRFQIPGGSTQTFIVDVTRNGYNGPIDLSLAGLPDCISVSGQQIPAGGLRGLLTLTATAGDPLPAITQLTAAGTGEHVNLKAIATVGANSAHYRVQPFLKTDLAISRAEQSPIVTSLTATERELECARGKFLPVTVNLSRIENTAGKIRLRLIASQIQPRKKIKQNNKDVEVDDLDRTLRLAEEPLLAPDVHTHTVNIWVPHDIGLSTWRTAIVAELMSADDKAVIATASTTQLTITPLDAIALELTSPANLEAVAGEGDTGSLTGTITRAAGFDKPVTVTLVGLPKGYTAPLIEIAADQTEFTLEVRFAKEAKPAELKNIKLVANAPTDLKPEVQVTSNQVNVQIKVIAQP